VLLHVVQLNIAAEERGIQRTRLLQELCRNAEFQLQQLADCLGGQVTAEILVCEGRPAEAIVETARRLQADTIVTSTHGCRGWRKWLHCNTARKVMRQAPCTIRLVSNPAFNSIEFDGIRIQAELNSFALFA
jgi:nucleotide-binding universal stress UspA family protein